MSKALFLELLLVGRSVYEYVITLGSFLRVPVLSWPGRAHSGEGGILPLE